MNRKLVVSGLAAVALFAGGCGANPSTPTPFEQSIAEKSKRYDEDAVMDGKFLDRVTKAREEGIITVDRTDEGYITYGKSICVLLDEAESLEVVDGSHGTKITQPLSQIAIEVYCPHHLE